MPVQVEHVRECNQKSDNGAGTLKTDAAGNRGRLVAVAVLSLGLTSCFAESEGPGAGGGGTTIVQAAEGGVYVLDRDKRTLRYCRSKDPKGTLGCGPPARVRSRD